jgi:hypothetical protein
MAKIGLQSLKQVLQKNVAEIRFTLRRSNLSGQRVRNMLCTLDDSILNSINGRTTLNFRPPKQNPPYNPAAKNLLLVWDIFMQDWRMVNMNDCSLINTITRDEFWKYFNDHIYGMTIQEKNQFMNR